MDAWLASPAHRRLVLAPGFRHVGIAVITGVPQATASGATYVIVPARRNDL
jgi:uncharacterized protein YkwD